MALVVAKGEPKPGVRQAIDLCRAHGLPLAVASSSEYRLIDLVLDHFGWADAFELVHSAEDEPYGKPHPGVFLTAATRLGVAPDRCLVWEDAPAGVLAAKAARMACVAVPETAERDRPAFALADAVLGSLEEADEAMWQRVSTVHRADPMAAPAAPTPAPALAPAPADWAIARHWPANPGNVFSDDRRRPARHRRRVRPRTGRARWPASGMAHRRGGRPGRRRRCRPRGRPLGNVRLLQLRRPDRVEPDRPRAHLRLRHLLGHRAHRQHTRHRDKQHSRFGRRGRDERDKRRLGRVGGRYRLGRRSHSQRRRGHRNDSGRGGRCRWRFGGRWRGSRARPAEGPRRRQWVRAPVGQPVPAGQDRPKRQARQRSGVSRYSRRGRRIGRIGWIGRVEQRGGRRIGRLGRWFGQQLGLGRQRRRLTETERLERFEPGGLDRRVQPGADGDEKRQAHPDRDLGGTR